MSNAAIYERTHILVGDEGLERLRAANIFLAGVGGVGGHCAEALVRGGVGRLTICDHDVVSNTNKNRQLVALDSTVGESKVAVLARRLHDINAHCSITALEALLLPEDVEDILTRQAYDYVVDCIDSVECKVALLAGAVRLGIRTYTSCGAGSRLDPSRVTTGDLFATENDALARCCRNELRKRGVRPGSIIAVHSTETARKPLQPQRQESGGRDRAINGTISYMPPLFGLLLAAAVMRHVLDPAQQEKEFKQQLKKILKKEKKEELERHNNRNRKDDKDKRSKHELKEEAKNSCIKLTTLPRNDMNVNLQKQYEEEGQGEEELQQHQQEQQHRAIWGRLAIAEVPYPIIAADDVVISLYTNRLLFRVASSTFTVIVFLRDVVRIVFFAEVNGIELQVKREDGGYRSYITTFREPNAALMLYDVMLPLLPSHVEDSSLAQAVTPCIYTTDYPFSLLSSCTMKEAGFYELCPRNISPLEGRDIAKHLFFPPEHHFLLSNEPPIMAPLNTAHPSLSSSISLPLSAPSLKQEQPDLVMRENFKQPSQHVESLQRDSEDVRRNSLQIPVTEVKDLESSQDEPRLVTYDVITGELKDYEDYTHNDFTPLSGGSGTVVDNITPISYSQSHPSPGPQPQSSNDLLPTRGPSVGMRSTTSGALRIPRGSETFSSSSPAVAEAAVKRTSGGILMPESRSVSAYSHWTGVGTTSAPMRLPRQSSNASSNDHVFHILVNYGPTEQF